MAGSRTLLIIEDDNELSITMELLLGKIGYSVRSAPTGQEGLRIWEEEHPRAVLLDIRLPDMDGYEVCRRMKENPSHRYTTAVVFLSALEESEIRTNGSAVCADYYIKKPVDPNDIGADLYTLYEKSFDLSEEDIYRLRVAQKVPPNTDPHPFASKTPRLETEPKAVAVRQPAQGPSPRPVVTASSPESGRSQSSMNLDQVKELLLALRGSLGRTRDNLGALMDYIEDTHP